MDYRGNQGKIDVINMVKEWELSNQLPFHTNPTVKVVETEQVRWDRIVLLGLALLTMVLWALLQVPVVVL